MNLMIFLTISIFAIVFLLLLEKKFGQNAIYLFGIGSIINGSIFHFYANTISTGNLSFGIDFLLHPMFFWCLYLMNKREGEKGARVMLIVSLCSLLFSGLMQFFANSLNFGFSHVFIKDLLEFLLYFSSFLISGFLFVFAINKFKATTNLFLTFALLLATCLINFLIIYLAQELLFFQTISPSLLVFALFMLALNLVFVITLKLLPVKKLAEKSTLIK